MIRKTTILIIILSSFFIYGTPVIFWTDFIMTIYITNKSDELKRLYIEKGRILEIAGVDKDYYQSVIITDGEGWVEVPPKRTIRRLIKGVCLNKGLKFPEKGSKIVLTPFVGNKELVAAGNDQTLVHSLTDFPRDNIQMIIAKGYSDEKKNGREKDRDEAFKNAVENAARESGFTFSSETLLENLKMIQTRQRISLEEKSIRLNKVVHEEYNEKSGEYLYIGEFEVSSKPTRPEKQ